MKRKSPRGGGRGGGRGSSSPSYSFVAQALRIMQFFNIRPTNQSQKKTHFSTYRPPLASNLPERNELNTHSARPQRTDHKKKKKNRHTVRRRPQTCRNERNSHSAEPACKNEAFSAGYFSLIAARWITLLVAIQAKRRPRKIVGAG